MTAFLTALIIVSIVVVAMFYLWPKGNLLYEGLHILPWLLRMKSLEKSWPMPPSIAYGTHRRQYLQHYRPVAGSVARKHAIVYVHGSGWMFGSPEMFKAEAESLCELGNHVFMISHRRTPQFHIGHLRQDFALAVRKVLELLEGQGLSYLKIILMGNSAGGNLCALAAFDRSLLSEAGIPCERIAGLALLAAPLDLRQMWPSPPLLMITRLRNSELMARANPANFICEAESLPILVVHGDKDGIVEYASSQAFVKQMQDLGASDLRFVTLQGGTHLDAASWCYPGHECSRQFFAWLAEQDSKN